MADSHGRPVNAVTVGLAVAMGVGVAEKQLRGGRGGGVLTVREVELETRCRRGDNPARDSSVASQAILLYSNTAAIKGRRGAATLGPLKHDP